MWPFGPSTPADSSSVASTSKPPTAASTTDTNDNDKGITDLIRALQGGEESEPSSESQIVAPTAAVGGVAPPITRPKRETLPDGRRVFEDGTVDITEKEMHPRYMSCRQAFDQAFYCQSLGGKFNDIYRFGELKSCSEQWGAFMWCMRTRTLGDGEKARQTVAHYEKRDAKRRAEHGSSEDVWEIRTRSVREAFGKDPDTANTQMTVQS